MPFTRILFPFVSSLFLLIMVIPSHADFQAGLAAYDQGDDATALKEFLPLAQQGDGKSQVNPKDLSIISFTMIFCPKWALPLCLTLRDTLF